MTLPLSTQDRGTLEASLRQTFPDAPVDDARTDALAIALWCSGSMALPIDWTPYDAELRARAAMLGLNVDPSATSPTRLALEEGAASDRYYNISATHDREVPDLAPFTRHFSMARVTLPQKQPQTFQTRLGAVEPGDHLLATVDELRQKYGGVLGAVERVDLVTPARAGGTRFGAISVYLGYRAGEHSPSFHVLEAGTATGDAKVLYLAPSLDTVINSFSGYKPTPFASPNHVYTARLRLQGDSPLLLQITVHRDAASLPYMRLTVNFEETPTPRLIWPGFLIADAASIVIFRQLSGVS